MYLGHVQTPLAETLAKSILQNQNSIKEMMESSQRSPNMEGWFERTKVGANSFMMSTGSLMGNDMSVERSRNDMTPWVNVIKRGTEPIAAALAIMLEIVQGHPGIILNNKGPLGEAALDEKEEEAIDKATKEKEQSGLQKAISSIVGFFTKDDSEKDLEDKRLKEKATKIEEKKVGILEGIWQNTKAKGKSVWDWIKSNWGLILAAVTVAFMPLGLLVKAVEKFMEMSWWEKLIGAAIAAGIALNSGLILKTIAGATASAILGMTTALTTWFTGTTFAKAMAASFIPPVGGASTGMKVLGAGMIVGAIALAIKDGFEGAKLAKEWDVSKAAGVTGAVLGGTSKGLEGAMSKMGEWALFGAGLGSFFPVVGTLIGGLIGAAVGALLGFVGGEKIANFFNDPVKHFKRLWDAMLVGIEIFVDDIRIYFIDPILNMFAGITKWSKDIFKKIAPDWLLKKLGNEPSQTKDDTTGTYRPQERDEATKTVLRKGSIEDLGKHRLSLVEEGERKGTDPARRAQINRDITAILRRIHSLYKVSVPTVPKNTSSIKTNVMDSVHKENTELKLKSDAVTVINNIDNSKKSSTSQQETTLVSQPSATHIIAPPSTSFSFR